MVLMFLVRTFIKIGNPHFFKWGVRLNRDYLKSSNRKILTFEYFIHIIYVMLLILLKNSCPNGIVNCLLEDSPISV